jgi:hypothetical protein
MHVGLNSIIYWRNVIKHNCVISIVSIYIISYYDALYKLPLGLRVYIIVRVPVDIFIIEENKQKN